VIPYALGNARHASAASVSFSKEYAYKGLPPAISIQAFAVSGVKKTDFSGFAMAIATAFLLLNPAGEKAPHGDRAPIVERARILLETMRILIV
jgi:hypothetical protein